MLLSVEVAPDFYKCMYTIFTRTLQLKLIFQFRLAFLHFVSFPQNLGGNLIMKTKANIRFSSLPLTWIKF